MAVSGARSAWIWRLGSQLPKPKNVVEGRALPTDQGRKDSGAGPARQHSSHERPIVGVQAPEVIDIATPAGSKRRSTAPCDRAVLYDARVCAPLICFPVV